MMGTSPAQIRDLPAPELAMVFLRQLAESKDQINLGNELLNFRQEFAHLPDRKLLLERISDAFAWIESRGLLGRTETDPHGNWGRLTTQGMALARDKDALTRIHAAERLAGNLDPALEAKVRSLFGMGDYETACFAAMKEVEVAVRTAACFDNSQIGVSMMRNAFNPQTGPLRDEQAESGERVAAMELFAGAIGAFKNPPSHRTVDFDDPIEAAEIVQLADLLLKILRRSEARNRKNKRQQK
jgi:uncharacterized protein (TIGR02391 family)